MIVTLAFLDSGVHIRMTGRLTCVNRGKEEGEESTTLGTFTASNTREAWYVREGFGVRIHVERPYPKNENCQGVAVRLVNRSDLNRYLLD